MVKSRLAIFLFALSISSAQASSDVIAQWGDVKVTIDDIQQIVQMADEPTRIRLNSNPASLMEIVRERVVRGALLLSAKAAKWDERAEVVSMAEDAKINFIVQSFLANQMKSVATNPTDEEIAKVYEATKARLLTPPQYHLSQIAIIVPASADKKTEEEFKKRALEIRKLAFMPKAEFSDLAKKYSQDKSSADKGGDLGWLREDVLAAPIRSAIMNIKINTVSDPIRTADAWHLIKVLDTRPSEIMTLEQSKDLIVVGLKQAQTQRAYQNFVAEILRENKIQINEIELARQFPPNSFSRK